MPPTKKSRGVKKRFSSLSDVSPDKYAGNASRIVQQKKKSSEKLGSQWSKEELVRFYEAYRKHGKDWKKVAAIVRNRSTEMVEALYNMNQVYLALPEGKASVVGLIAAMTGHYNDDSDSGQESNDASERSQKRKRARVRLNILKEDHLQSQPATSNDGCLSLLKKRRTDGMQPRVVGKRTPRFPVSYTKKEDRNNHALPNKRGRKSEVDDDVLCVAAVALTEASKRGGSPQGSRTPRGRTVHTNSSPVRSWERRSAPDQGKLRDASMDENWGAGSRDETGGYARDSNSLIHVEGVGMVEVNRKGKKFNKNEKAEHIANYQYDDGGEACSGTEGLNVCASRGKCDMDVSNVKVGYSSPQGQRKRNKKHLFGVSVDESSALDALQTLADLADLSQTMAASTMESESYIQLKEESTSVDLDDKSSAREATSTIRHQEKIKFLRPKEKAIHAGSGVEVTTKSRRSNLGRDSLIDVNVIEAKQPLSANKTSKRKRKSSAPKVPNTECHLEAQLSQLGSEDLAEAGTKSGAKSRLSTQISGLLKQRRSIKYSEGSFISDQKRMGIDSSVSTGQIPTLNQINLPGKQRSRRKLNRQRFFIPEEMKFSGNHNILKSQSNGSLYLKKKLVCCLASHIARRWCTFEWFYSAIDLPWFAKSEFVEYLNHVGLGHIPRLTRVEWGVIRSSLGKPRRFSEQFLCEERQKLKQYRESVRKHYTELHNGTREGLPTDLARPLSVGQRVVALHPKTREVYNGSVLTVDHDKCRVQFDRPEIGVEFVKDIDCMPSNPLDNMPEALRRQSIVADKSSGTPKDQQVNGCSNFGGSVLYVSNGPVENVISSMNTSAKLSKGGGHHTISKTTAAVCGSLSAQQTISSQPYTVAHVQAREADVRSLSEMTRALDKKEALLLELSSRNNEVSMNQTYGDSTLRESEVFKKHYATVLVQLRAASGQVSNSLHNLRERNTYPGNPLPPWLKPPLRSNLPASLPCSLNNSSLASQEPGSKVVQIVKGSRAQAHAMVDAAIQAMPLVKGGEDAFTKIGEALDSLGTQQLPYDSKAQIEPPEQVNGSLGQLTQLTPGISETSPPSPVMNGPQKYQTQIPSELITSCVSTLRMIQACTERQYPPAEVAQILDFAVTTLRPCCDQNQPIYREIQMSMGRLKTQILALIPTSI